MYIIEDSFVYQVEKTEHFEDNAETVEIDGNEYKADKGRITVPKELSESEAKVKELEELLNSLGKQLAKEKIENMKKDKTISELGKQE